MAVAVPRPPVPPATASWWASRGAAAAGSRALAIAAGYLFLAWVGTTVSVRPDEAAPVWLAAAIGAAAVARLPRHTWPSVLVGVFAAEMLSDLRFGGMTVAAALAYSVGNTVEALVAGLLLRRTDAVVLERPRALVGLTVSAFGAAVVGATLAAPGLWWSSGLPLFGTWREWVAGDAIGLILLAPLLLATGWTAPRTLTRWAELVAVVVSTVGLTLVVFSRPTEPGSFTLSQALLVPAMAWAGLRFGIVVVSALAPLVLMLGLAGTMRGDGPFALGPETSGQVLALQLFVLVASLAVFAVALMEEERHRAEQRERTSRALVDQLLENTPAMIFVKSYDGDGEDGRYVLVNRRFSDAVGRPADRVLGHSEHELLPAYADQFCAEDREVLAEDQPAVYEGSTVRADGVERFHHTAKFPIHDEHGRAVAVGAVAMDLTEARRREELLREMFDRSPVPTARVSVGDPGDGIVLDANEALGALLGVPPADLVGRSLDGLLHADERQVPLLPPDPAGAGGSAERERRLVATDGRDVWVRVTVAPIRATATEPGFALLTLQDVTSRRRAEENLTHQALHDQLTGLPNRTALMDRLAAAMGRLWRQPSYVAVLFCDIDGFKHLNDTRGHRVGDTVLAEVATRLRVALRPEDTLARPGGDEFVVVAEGLRTAGEARLVGDALRNALSAPIRLGDTQHALTLSVGVATTTDPGTRPEDLLRRADLAMYRAKDAGRDRVEFYVAELEEKVVAQLAAQDLLRSALAEDRIVADFQPVVSLSTGEVVGAEALARLLHPEEGVLPPARFIDEAEQSGLVNPLGERMLSLALAQSSAWTSTGRRLRVAINTSPRQLANAGFAAHVLQLIASAGLDPDDLVVEVTERAVVDASGPTILALRRLRDQGVHVAIDDFGTGYATLSGLKHLPADIVKIDRAFVSGVVDDPDDAAIVAAVIRVAHDLGRTVVAEGVETEEQQAVLVAFGCDEAQGYLYSRPVPPAEFPLAPLAPAFPRVRAVPDPRWA